MSNSAKPPERQFIYVIAWSDAADQPPKFRHRALSATAKDVAYLEGQQWAEKEGLLSLNVPSNDYVIDLAEATLREIPGVEFLEVREKGAKPVAGPFAADELEALVRMARMTRNAAGERAIFIAPEVSGFTIFQRRSA